MNATLANATLKIRAIAPGELDAIRRAARLDGHTVMFATHVIESDTGEIVGYASVAAVPLLTGWLHSRNVSPEDGRNVIAQLEEIAARETGAKLLLFPCTDDCRFLNDMNAMGYHRISEVTLFLKRLAERSSHG